MNVNPEGTGEILIYPYFTTQESEGNAYNTYLSIVNHNGSARAVRVRLREGRNGREVASFNLMLGPRDTWVAAIVPTPLGARLVTTDASCVTPELSPPPAAGQAMFLDLSPSDYTGSRADTFGTDVERLREGYAEVFEMAQLAEPPPACANFRASQPGALTKPAGQLSGTLTLINVQSGLDFTLNPVALADVATAPYFRAASDPYPDYSALEIASYAGFFNGEKFYRTVWNSSLDAVNAALLTETLLNEVIMDRGTRSGTDFIVTFPTKRLAANDMEPFHFQEGRDRRVVYGLDFTTREGEWLQFAAGCDFGICFPEMDSRLELLLPWSSTVLSLRTTDGQTTAGAVISDVLGSRNGRFLNMATSAQNGAVRMRMDGTMRPSIPVRDRRIVLSDGAEQSPPSWYSGLPAVGFMVRTFRNGNLACAGATCQGNYGGAFEHRRIRASWPP